MKKGIKYDKGKLRWTLLPWRELEDVVKVLDSAAFEYGEEDWKDLQNGISRYKNALIRHLASYINGEFLDKKSKMPHLAHIVCNALFLMWLHRNNKK